MNRKNDQFNLPPSWQLVRLGDFVNSEKGKKPKRENSVKTSTHYLPYIDIEAFESGVLKSWTDGENCKICNENDFLMVWDGSRSGLVGKGIHGALGSTLVKISFPQIHNNYAYYFLKSKFLEINTRAKGSGTPHVDPDLLWNYDFPVPPFEEQKRIVAKIEEFFSEIDKGIENLLKAQELLKAYRQSILKNAFEGKLTEQWREGQELCIEDSKQLLQHIFEERRQRSKVPENYKEPENLNLTGLPALPKEWLYTTLGALCEIRGGLTVDAKKETAISNPIEVPYLRVANVQDGYLDFKHIKLIKTDQEKADQLLLKVGDVLFTEGGDRDKLGRGWVWDGQIEYCIHQNHIFRARPYTQEVNSKFLSYYSGVFGKAYFLREGKQTTNLASISLNKLRAFPVPLPSYAEQLEIVRIIDSAQSMISHLEKTFEIELKRSNSLRQSILKKAFSGELVSQDTHDEPASTLLEHIKAEKETKQPKKKQSKQLQKVAI